jgi:hypothetical protein
MSNLVESDNVNDDRGFLLLFIIPEGSMARRAGFEYGSSLSF